MSAPSKLTTGEKLGFTTLLVLGLAGDSILEVILHASAWQLALAFLVTLPLLGFAACAAYVRHDERQRRTSRTIYLARTDAERAAR